MVGELCCAHSVVPSMAQELPKPFPSLQWPRSLELILMLHSGPDQPGLCPEEPSKGFTLCPNPSLLRDINPHIGMTWIYCTFPSWSRAHLQSREGAEL